MSNIEFAIYGAGKVGTALAAELGGQFPVYSRNTPASDRKLPHTAIVCWPAHALSTLTATFPELHSAHVVTFANGLWAGRETRVDEEGICYCRLQGTGPWPRGKWRVARADTAARLRRYGMGVTASDNHRPYVIGKALYILPLAITCAELDVTAKEAIDTPMWVEWFSVVYDLGVLEVGHSSMESQAKRAMWLCDRLPRRWRPSSSPEEIAYFKRSLCAE